MDKENFLSLINSLAELYNESLSEVKLNLYFECLKEYSNKQLQDATIRIAKTRVYPSMPKPAEIIEYIDGKLEDRAILAWDTAIRTAEKHDYYFTISFEDKIINGVIQAMGGWEIFSSMLISEQPFRRKEFLELYKAYARSRRYCSEKLIGNFERINQEVEQTKLIEADYLRKDQKQIQ